MAGTHKALDTWDVRLCANTDMSRRSGYTRTDTFALRATNSPWDKMLQWLLRRVSFIGYLGLLAAISTLVVDGAGAGQLVEFETAFKSPVRLLGYLAKPDGPGPFAAIVILHGCDGFNPGMPIVADRLKSWGYVALAIDSLGPRHRSNACAGGSPDQPLDAYAALNFLTMQRFVDPDRVGVLGFSMGGGSALLAGESGFIEQLFPRKFRAVVAFYPVCAGRSGIMVAPALILIGALDDWTPAQTCQEIVKKADVDGGTIDLVVYPGVYHGFANRLLQPGERYFGHWLEYNEAATTDALTRTRQFLDAHLNVHQSP
jgi:dienelactone hydrolase